ncbi:DUF6119 family protein [Pedobacter sp. BMA]|uniref:DUF6119 family protein n=1 Tax=Pedobacter sp. BMA TaxID=1663685 RepID=UPI00064A5F11|nr:DUF6119 family protein [Pedobacter sp. BMA]KLT63927.1 hypothetical protein AB669_19555 [Pedobacter sp. BMA]
MTILPNIFKIDLDNYKLTGLSSTLSKINAIVRTAKEKSSLPGTSEDFHVNSFTKDQINYYMYLFDDEDKTSDWAGFLPRELSEGKNFVQKKVSLILFFETYNELFAIVGGNAYPAIVGFIDQSFGLNTYDKIVSREDDEMTGIKYWGITGQKIKVNEHFRDDYRIINYLKFGKVPEEMSVKLAHKTTDEYFGFLLEKPAERLQLTVGRSLKIKKEIDFDTLHKIALELSHIVGVDSKNFLSSYIEVKDQGRITRYKDALIDKIFNHIAFLQGYDKSESNKFEFDFCNPKKVEAFYEANRFQLKEKSDDGTNLFATVTDRSLIYRTVLDRALQVNGYSRFEIMVFLQGVRILSFLDNKKTAESMFLYHISAELSVDGESVFYLDNKWYNIKDSFVDDLKSQTERIFRTFRLDPNVLNEPWPKKEDSILMLDENEYNMKYDLQSGYIVGDELITDGVEVFDILHYTAKEFYLIHVKHGFTARVRELTNQILISARRVSEAKSSGNKRFFGKLYDQLQAAGRSVDGLTKTEFVDLFLKREPIYVFATCSQLDHDLPIEDNINRYRSNIARFSLVTCSSEVRNSYFEMLTYQIPKG